MNIQPQRFGIPSHQGLSDSYASSRSDPTYLSISSGHNPLSVHTATFANRAHGGVSFNVGSDRPCSSAGNYPTNGFSRNADMHSNSSCGYVITEQVHQPPRQRESPFTCKRWILIGCIVIIVLLIGGVATATSLLIPLKACTRECHTCTSSSEKGSKLCPGNGTMTINTIWPPRNCPCDTTCYTQIRSENEHAVHRGCTEDFPNWKVLDTANKNCQIIKTNRVCFCHGDRCNTHDMTAFPEYKYKD